MEICHRRYMSVIDFRVRLGCIDRHLQYEIFSAQKQGMSEKIPMDDYSAQKHTIYANVGASGFVVYEQDEMKCGLLWCYGVQENTCIITSHV